MSKIHHFTYRGTAYRATCSGREVHVYRDAETVHDREHVGSYSRRGEYLEGGAFDTHFRALATRPWHPSGGGIDLYEAIDRAGRIVVRARTVVGGQLLAHEVEISKAQATAIADNAKDCDLGSDRSHGFVGTGWQYRKPAVRSAEPPTLTFRAPALVK